MTNTDADEQTNRPGRPRTDRGRGAPQVVVRLSEDEHAQLEQDATERDISPAEVLRRSYFGASAGLTPIEADVLAVAKRAGLFRADMFGRPEARRALRALVAKGLVQKYGDQYRTA